VIKIATIKDVAEKAGVSTATVSHVINETRFVSESTKEKVIQSMKELNYKPNKLASSLRSKKSNIIGFIVPDIANFFFTGIAHYIEKELKQRGYSLFISNSDENIENEKQQFEKLKAHFVDGIIVAPAKGDHSFLVDMNKENECPIVFIDRKPDNIKGVSILVDNVNGSYKAITHFIEKGHKKIGIITGLPGITSTYERLEGYKKALADNNIPIKNGYIKIGDSRFDSGYKLTKELVKNTDISALYVTNNLMCVGAMEYLNDKDITIPDDIAIIGFDDYKWASITNPPLSVISQPIKKIGESTVKELMSLIRKDNNKKININKTIRMKTKFIIRESC